jgi:hypothetical protein
MMGTDIFQSPEKFSDAFAQGLASMLDHDGLGVFILVCANAGFSPALQQLLSPALKMRYQRHAEQYREALMQGYVLPDADDDVLVFLKMMAIGFEALCPSEFQSVGPWEAQFNPLRSFRPPRMAHSRVEAVHAPFDENGFHFNKPFLRKECFWSGTLEGREVELLYNKFPFVDYHGLLVPQREHNAPQFLTRDDHFYLWRVCEAIGRRLPGVGFGYNAYGAYASVNHLHFQMYRRESPLPVELPVWRHNGGNRPYPSDCKRFDEAAAAWAFIESLHGDGISYNLLYVPGGLYCLPRRKQGSYHHAAWTAGYAWYEMCGGVVTFNRPQYEALDAAVIEKEFETLRLGL